MTDRSRLNRPALAAALSFVVPGLGQAYASRYLAAVLFALPVVLLTALAVVGLALLGDRLRNELFSHRFLVGLLIVNLALLAWRLAAICHAWLVKGGQGPETDHGPDQRLAARDRRRTPATLVTVAALLVLTVGMHAYAAIVIDRFNSALGQVFSGGVSEPEPGGGPPPQEDEDDAAPLNVPAFQWDGTERINFLLLGIDAGPGREHALSDTILMISVDPVSEEAIMISIPRDTGFVPLPSTEIYADGVYPNKINELAPEADANRELWCPDLPSDRRCGIRVLQRTVSLYLGTPIHYYARVDLVGFTELIDAVGGVELCLDGRLVDEEYTPTGDAPRGIELPPGCHRYDGEDALAYARIRRGYMVLPDGTREQQSDFLRNERQQDVLLALRRELATADLVFELPGLLGAIGRTVTTDFPRDKAGDLGSLLPLITGDGIEREVLGPPEFVDPPRDPEANYLLVPRRDAIRERMAELFGPELDGWYLGTEEPIPPPPDEDDAAATGRKLTRITAA